MIYNIISNGLTLYADLLQFVFVDNQLYQFIRSIFLPVLSVIVAVAVLIVPGVTLLPNDERIVKPRLNVSGFSAISSMFTDILIVVLSVPAVKVAVIGVEV